MDRIQRRDDPAAMIRAALRGMMSELWSALPGIVESVDLERQTVTVQPATKSRIRLDDGTYTSVPLPLLPDVPIVFPRGGGFALTFPIQPGDECLVIFADRCIDAWWQSGEVQEQADLRQHDLSDGIAIFGPCSQPRKLSDVSADSVQLRSEDAQTTVTLGSGKIELIADEVVIHGRTSTRIDAGGTGVSYAPGAQKNYVVGASVANLPIAPPQVPA